MTLPVKQPNPRPTEAFRAIVVALAKKTTLSTAANAYGVSVSSVHRWVKLAA